MCGLTMLELGCLGCLGWYHDGPMMGLEESFQNHPTIQVNFDIQHNSARLMGLCLDSLSSISSLRDYVEAFFWMDGLLFRDISV